MAAIEAATWRLQNEQARMMSLAWYTAALMRAKRLPPLAQLLAQLKPRKNVPIERRRDEFEELKARMSSTKYTKGTKREK
jgi:hypothetical protein